MITDDGQFTARIPREIRHDSDIEAKLAELDQATKAYLAFDMNKFQETMNRELESHIGKLNHEYKAHTTSVNAKLEACEAANADSLALREDLISQRLLKQEALAALTAQSALYQEHFSQVNASKHSLRTRLSLLERRLREVQRELAATDLESSALKAVLAGQHELHEERRVEEADAWALVSEDLRVQTALQREDRARLLRQREFAEAQNLGYEAAAREQQARVAELVKAIEMSKQKS